MSFEYDRYLIQHRENVAEAFRWIRDNIPEVLKDESENHYEHQICFAHDASKDEPDEYKPYDDYFYGGNRSYKVVEDFRFAWLTHIHRNPHHWQHWILVNDDPDEGTIVMDMPYNYIIEMICDWWAFSFSKDELGEIFDWYEQHAGYMKLSDNTRVEVEAILGKIKAKLSEASDGGDVVTGDEGMDVCQGSQEGDSYRNRCDRRWRCSVQGL